MEQYEDLPGLRPKELQLLSAPPPGEDDLAEFYVRFSKVKDFHRRNTNINTRQFVNDLDEMVKGDGLQTVYVEDEEEPMIIEPLDSVFSGEEGYGKHLDLYLYHTQYLNLRGASRLSYIGYIDMLRHGKVERTLDVKEKSVPAYLEYVQTLYNYIVSFFDRALPLIDIHKQIRDLEEQFEISWAGGQVEGWEPESSSSKGKSALNTEGIWCPYCQKNYSKQTVYDAHLNSEKHKRRERENKPVSDPSKANGNGTSHAASASSSSSNRDRLRAPARLTYLIQALLKVDPIPARLSQTRNETERKMALTAREREQELEEQDEAPPPVEIAPEEEEEDDDGTIYNPLKLPLGWDGKPIPFWLYKLHGLGVTFSCEIW